MAETSPDQQHRAIEQKRKGCQVGCYDMSDSLITKKAIATGIKELLKKKSFDKITVSDITQACGLNRQTFYYHFQDKYELVDWIYYNEAISIIVDDLDYDNWNSKVLQFLKKIKEEDYFYINTLKASVENEFREYLFKVTVELLCGVIHDITSDTGVNDKDINFIAEFFAFGLIGVIVAWVQNGMKETPEYVASQLKYMVEGTEKYATLRYQNKLQKAGDDL
ncbi:MAG: dihydroxyacetone kinase transcriptional activator DhaS [Firmicutes bacterium]|nr:dihydroxyacetone kinase transcriptional activator DhaS [Bacillota bacterium]